MKTSIPVVTLSLLASASASASADTVYAVITPPTSHGKNRAYGGDADSWDLLIGYTQETFTLDTKTPAFAVASKGCWPESEYYEGVYYSFGFNTGAIPDLQYASACASDLSNYLDDLYGDQPYLRVDYFNDTDCTALDFVNVMIADDACHPRYALKNATSNVEPESRLVTIAGDGSATFTKFDSGDCSGNATERLSFTKDQIDKQECVNGVVPSTASSGLSGGAIAGIVIGVAAAVALVAWAVWFYRRRRATTSIASPSSQAYAKA